MVNFLSLCLITLMFSEINTMMVGYDCISKPINISVISLSDVTQCNIEKQALKEEDEFIQVIQTRQSVNIQVFSCLISVSTLVTHCGMHSHASISYKGFNVNEVYDVSHSVCDKLTKYNEFRTLGGKTLTNIKNNSTTTRSVIDHGEITDVQSSNCKGTDVYLDDIFYRDVMVQRSYTITLRSHIGVMDNDDLSIKLSSGYTYKYKDGRGFDPDFGYSFWDIHGLNVECTTNRLMVIYSGQGNVLTTALGDKTVIINTPEQIMAIGLKQKTIICNTHTYLTDHPKVYVILGKNNILPKIESDIDVNNLDMFLYMNSKFVYIERHFKTQLEILYSNLQNQICMQNYQLLNQLLSLAYISPEEFAWSYTKSPGITAILRGEAIYLVKCIPVTVEHYPTITCYQEIPVTYKNKTMYLKPRSRILTEIGTEIDCNPLAPTLFKFGGTWLTNTYPSVPVKAPIQLTADNQDKWKYIETSEIIKAGFYKLSDLEAYQRKLMFPLEKPAIENILASKSIGVKLDSQSVDLLRMFDKSHIEQIKVSLFEAIYGWTWKISVFMGGFSGFLIILMILKSIFSMVLNGTVLYRTFGFSFKLLSAMWGTLAKHVLYFNIVKKMGEDIEKATAPPCSTDEISPLAVDDNNREATRIYPTLDPQEQIRNLSIQTSSKSSFLG